MRRPRNDGLEQVGKYMGVNTKCEDPMLTPFREPPSWKLLCRMEGGKSSVNE